MTVPYHPVSNGVAECTIESSIDHTEDEMDDCGGMAGSASIASLWLEYAALLMVPWGFVVAGLVPGQVVDLGHAISL